MIESVNNEKIKRYAKLQIKKYRDAEGLFIVEGEHLVEEAKKQDLLVDVFSLDGHIGTMVSESVMRKLSSLKNCPQVLGIARFLPKREVTGNILILDNIQDPGNLGTIIRSAVAFNIKTILASPNTVDIYNPKVMRASEGMLFHINYITCDLIEAVKKLAGYEILTTNVSEGNSLADFKITKPYALIMGNEGSGVSKTLADAATDTLNIPLNKECESLNVAIATSIILYELNKQKNIN